MMKQFLTDYPLFLEAYDDALVRGGGGEAEQRDLKEKHLLARRARGAPAGSRTPRSRIRGARCASSPPR